MKNANERVLYKDKKEKRISQNINNIELNKKREKIVPRGLDFFKKRKSISMRHIQKNNKKINIYLNNNININTNIKEIKEEKEEDNCSKNQAKSLEGNQKDKRITIEKQRSNKRSFNINSCMNLDNINNKNKEKDSKSISKDKSRDIESSSKVDKLLLNQLKIDTKDEKKEEFIEFYINDNDKNKFYDLKDNNITTTKYNIFTFIPKGLLYQFSRLSNVYFLFTAIIQSIPIISPLTSLTAIVPLIFVLGVSMIREAIEDCVRNNYDNLNNEEEVIVYRNNKFVKSISQTLKHGEIVLVYENHNIPSDMILIDTGFGEGTCYVETSSLDGEKTLKLKVANKYTQGFISNDIKINKSIEKFIQPNKYMFDGYIKINAPNANLNYVNGTLHALFSKDGKEINQDINISINEFLLKGSILKNTNWIIGIVVYTGMNNKIILNSKQPRLKMSKVEKKLNLYLLFVFGFLIVCCAECSLYHHFHYEKHKNFYNNFIFISNDMNTESFIIYFTYFLLLNTLIPISLIVSTEIIKMIQAIFIKWDILLYSKSRHCFCNVKSVSIIEELGNVNFIFSDKTGTLTKNQLQFKYCLIDTKYYEYIKIGGIQKKIRTSKRHESIRSNEFFNKKGEIKNKKNSFFSENNKLLINKINIINEDKYIIKKNYNIKTDNISMAIIYNKLSDKSLNKYKMNKQDNSVYNNYSNSLGSSKSPSSHKIKKENNQNNQNTKSINNSNNKSKSKIRSKNQSDVSMITVNNTSNHQNSCLNNSDNSNSNSNSSHNKSKNIVNDNDKENNNNTIISINNINNKVEQLLKKARNSTILEVKNEENETNSMPNEIIQFGEGYFTDIENNPFLKIISYNNMDNTFNYINDFWTALALTNECIVKYDNKGEIKYMSTSPDDLELVKTAAQQGYKLVETSIDTKTIRISGKDYSYEILKVLGFSSERKRMSIIVKYNDEIKLYTKGADCEISKRLSKKSLENENFGIISKGLIDFSKKGLRTLMVAYRKINNDDYNFWVSRLHEDELNIQNKQKLIDRLYDIIENNLTLIGGTVVEDKLQDNVPETIRELRAAGIKIWVLTGDKLDTAENIGYSCNLLSKEQKLFTLKMLTGEDTVRDPFFEIDEFFFEFQEFLDQLIKKYNLDSKYYNNIKNNSSNNSYKLDILSEPSLNQSQLDRSSYNTSNSSNSKIINFEMYKYLVEKELLEPFSIIIESPILAELFTDNECTHNFLRIAYYSNTVICCRISPSQKSEVIQKMKSFDSRAVTLAIGDGGNDVSMIMEANIGVGIYGEEGLSATQASDFSIGEFQLLRRLLFIHGRVNLYRISEMILYFFFKNFTFTMIQFYFSFICLASGQTIIDDWYITCYNLIFTALPLCVRAITDSDIDLDDVKHTKKNLAILYKENRDEYNIFTFSHLIWKLIKGVIISLIIFVSCMINEILIKGYNDNIWYLSLKSYISILIIVSANLLNNSYFIVYLLPLTIGITTFLIFIIFLILNHYGILFEFNSKASIFTSLSSPLIYFYIFLVCSIHFILDYSTKLMNLLIIRSLVNRLNLRKSAKKRKKSCPNNSKLNISKTNSKNFNNKRRDSLNNDERSRTYLLSKPYNKLNMINKDYKNPTQSNNMKIEHTVYKNNFYSLNILKNINNNHNFSNNINFDNSSNYEL